METTIETIWRCSVIVEEGINLQEAPTQREHMFNQVNEFLQNLRTIEEEARKLPPILVDETIVKKLDDGVNPDLVTQEKLFEAHQKNAFTRGKLFSTKVYRDQLTAKLEHHRALREQEQQGQPQGQQPSTLALQAPQQTPSMTMHLPG